MTLLHNEKLTLTKKRNFAANSCSLLVPELDFSTTTKLSSASFVLNFSYQPLNTGVS